jgi:oligopeptide transport system substrate-binding protein
VWFNKEGDNIDIIESVCSMWEDNLGVKTEMVTWEWKVYLDTLDVCNTPPMTPAECEYNAYRLGWVMDYGDPNNMLNEVFAPGSPFQYTGWENARFTELMKLGLEETDMAKRIEYYKEADKIACEDVVMVIPLFYYDRTRLIKTGIHYEYPPFGSPYLKDWYFEE